MAGLSQAERVATRPVLQQRFLEALKSPGERRALPRRIVLFGTTHIPNQTLEALCALSAHCQVLMAVPNPCRFHWADIIDGRELLRAPRHRHPSRAGRELASVALQDMHVHAHPLLAAWGRQARDFVRQLDTFDDVEQTRARFDAPRVDLFDEGSGGSLLEQVQARIRDLVPLAEHPGVEVPPADRSIVFHVAHSAQREVEILHDQLLHLFANAPGGRALNPREVVVMVPDIDSFAAAIRSVFGQQARGHARYIPWGIADQRDRGHHPLLVALEWLLRAPQQRFAFSELRDLLDVPAVAQRFEIEAEDLPLLVAWIEGAAIRWGLHTAHRESLGLQACGETNTWHFGLQRMLLGYATGDLDAGFNDIEPYGEVAGLSAGLAGALAELLGTLDAWWLDGAVPRSPHAWGERLRRLVTELFAATDDADRALMAALDDALTAWLQACEAATFDAAVDLAVVRESWLEAVDESGAPRRFKAGGVTFCTLLPMRAIPFEVVCLLGMNDGDYPRRSPRSDFDLMALPGQSRPGDRSRRDDDRQLMLDALLSARRVLYVSWAGRSQRDNQEQAPSVLVAQLRDYLAAGWGPEVVRERTVEHPMQPFSRKYFEPKAQGAGADGLITYATEWRAAYAESPAEAQATDPQMEPGRAVGETVVPLTVARLASFLRNPVKEFFRLRLQVSFDDAEATAQDDESFATVGLERWQLLDDAIHATRQQIEAADAAHEPFASGDVVAAQVARLNRAGRLPMAGPGARIEAALVETLVPMVNHWQTLRAEHPHLREKQVLRRVHADDPTIVLDDWLVDLRSTDETGALPVWIELQASKLADRKLEAPRPEKLLTAWVRCLASAACGQPANGFVIGADALVRVTPPTQESARATLQSLMQACHEGLRGAGPVPTAVRTGLAYLDDPGKACKVYEGGGDFGAVGEGSEACLARLYPDCAALFASPGFEASTRRLYAPYREWLAQQVVEELPDHAAVEGLDDE
ncbi:MAG: exodeoxyribonuclease V subunit gamma [Burkholderiaceae bacterium]